MNQYHSRRIALTIIAALPILLAGGCCKKPGKAEVVVSPENQLVTVGYTATFNVAGQQPAGASYQWIFNGSKIPGATYSSLQISNVQFANVGIYKVEQKTEKKHKTSAPAFLSASSSTNGGNDGTLSQVIDAFGPPSSPCVSGFTKYYSFFPTTPPYGFVPPTGTTKLAIDTFITSNNPYDTAVQIFQRPGLASICCNDNATPVPAGFNAWLSCCTNITTNPNNNYRFGLYAKGNIPAGTYLYLNYHWY